MTDPLSSQRGEIYWRRNLYVCLFGSFTTVCGMTVVLPFLPVFVHQLGVEGEEATLWWSGIAFGAAFLSAAVCAPLWGRLGDLYGRKLMLVRASLGMAVAISLLGLAQDVYQLTALRFLVGFLGGYASGSVILVATQTPGPRLAQALAVLSMGVMGGTLVGPLAGGILPAYIGIRGTFWLCGGVIFIAFLATAFVIKETPRPPRTKKQSGELADESLKIPDIRPVVAMLVTGMLLLFATLSIEPILTVYISGLEPEADAHRATFLAGLIFSATALGSILSALWIGRLADRVGHWRVLIVSLVLIGLTLIPQAFVSNPWQLLALRFAMGVFGGGLIPCVTAVLRQSVPDKRAGAVLGLSTSAQFTGQVLGPLSGGFLAAHGGIRAVFIMTSVVMLTGALGNLILVRRLAREGRGKARVKKDSG